MNIGKSALTLVVGVGMWMVAAAPSAFGDDVAVIVGFHGEIDEGVFAQQGGKATTRLVSANGCAGRVPSGSLKALRLSPGVAFVEEDVILHASLVPNDPQYAANQAAKFNLINCPAAWSISTGNGIRVAVLDTGVRSTHEDLGSGVSGKVKTGMNFTTEGVPGDFSDGHGHGTHTSGTAGSKSNNGVGVASAGFNCELAMGKVLDSGGSGFTSWIGNGIDWASTTSGAKIISMSLGGGGTIALQNSVDSAWTNGLVIVAAAGNDATNDISNAYPGAYVNCIAVASTNSSGILSGFSNWGSWVDIAAPGESIVSTYNTNDSSYAFLSGTSMATPHVAGVCALVWALNPAAANSAIRDRIEGSSTTFVLMPDGNSIPLLDALAAVNSAATVPTVRVTAPVNSASEASGTPGTFLVKRMGTSNAAMTVHFTVGGTAVSGTDYTSIGTTVNLAAGQSEATVNVTPLQQGKIGGSATVILTLAANAAYNIGTPNNATVTIQFDDNSVTVAATTPNAAEAGPVVGIFTVTRAGTTASALQVNFTVTGTAVSGIDYVSLGTSVTIPSGNSSAMVFVSPIDSKKVAGSGTVILTLAAGGYVLGGTTTDTVTIQYNDNTVTVAATIPDASEVTLAPGVFTVSRTGSNTLALGVNLSVSGTAVSDIDYEPIGTTVIIPAAASSATVTVTPKYAAKFSGQETVIVALAAGPSYVISAPSQDTVTIHDDFPPPSNKSRKKCGALGLELTLALVLASCARRKRTRHVAP